MIINTLGLFVQAHQGREDCCHDTHNTDSSEKVSWHGNNTYYPAQTMAQAHFEMKSFKEITLCLDY
jgi:hypothetical protein